MTTEELNKAISEGALTQEELAEYNRNLHTEIRDVQSKIIELMQSYIDYLEAKLNDKH